MTARFDRVDRKYLLALRTGRECNIEVVVCEPRMGDDWIWRVRVARREEIAEGERCMEHWNWTRRRMKSRLCFPDTP
jgi:hypothetical protein